MLRLKKKQKVAVPTYHSIIYATVMLMQQSDNLHAHVMPIHREMVF